MTRLPRHPWLAACLPAALAGALTAIAFLDNTGRNLVVRRTLLAAAFIILVWNAVLTGPARRRFTVNLHLRPQHYIQACAQGSVLLYWGWYWRPVYDAVPLIAAQLIFAYAFDMLLGWSRRGTYTLGFGPVPRDLQHQPVPLVQARLVLPTVLDAGAQASRPRS